MRIRTLEESDVPAALRLSTQAGWNQVEADWHRLLALAPDTCFAGVVDEELVATSTLICYEDVGWIGMVLVSEAHQRQGYGMTIFRRALDAGQEAGLDVIGLDATDAGRAVYRQVDFVDVAPIERWAGRLDVQASEGAPSVVRTPDFARLQRIDASACGVDRGALLSRLLSEADTRFVLATDDSGYAVVRPGRTHAHVGPIVAEDTDTLRELLGALTGAVADRPVYVDAFPEQAALGDFGLEPQRHLTRMTHGTGSHALMGPRTVAAAGFELG